MTHQKSLILFWVWDDAHLPKCPFLWYYSLMPQIYLRNWLESIKKTYQLGWPITKNQLCCQFGWYPSPQISFPLIYSLHGSNSPQKLTSIDQENLPTWMTWQKKSTLLSVWMIPIFPNLIFPDSTNFITQIHHRNLLQLIKKTHQFEWPVRKNNSFLSFVDNHLPKSHFLG